MISLITVVANVVIPIAENTTSAPLFIENIDACDSLLHKLSTLLLICVLAILLYHMMDKHHSSFIPTTIASTTWESSPEYRHFKKLEAYKSYYQFSTQNECPICLQNMSQTSSLRLLHCGHLFHTKCVKHYERNLWRNNDIDNPENNEPNNFNLNVSHFPYSQCAICRGLYHYKRQKFKYCPSFWDSLHPLQRVTGHVGGVSYFANIGAMSFP